MYAINFKLKENLVAQVINFGRQYHKLKMKIIETENNWKMVSFKFVSKVNEIFKYFEMFIKLN